MTVKTKIAIAVFALIFSLGSVTRSQVFVLAGYQLAHAPVPDLNFIHGRYNETRSWLADTMSRVKILHGPLLYVHAPFSDRFYFAAAWTYLHQREFAQGIPTGSVNPAERQVRFRVNTRKIGLGMYLTGGIIRIGFGTSLDFGSIQYHTRSAANATLIGDEKWTKVVGKFTIASSLNMLIHAAITEKVVFMISPFAQFQWWQTEFAPVNEAINSATSGSDPSSLKSNAKNFGASFTLGYGF